MEIGADPGRLLIPAARRVMPGGEVVGIDIDSISSPSRSHLLR